MKRSGGCPVMLKHLRERRGESGALHGAQASLPCESERSDVERERRAGQGPAVGRIHMVLPALE